MKNHHVREEEENERLEYSIQKQEKATIELWNIDVQQRCTRCLARIISQLYTLFYYFLYSSFLALYLLHKNVKELQRQK
jgi:hypothetical protein